MIAVTQSRGIGPGPAYLDKLIAGGKTRTEAIRLLRRRISDAVYTALRTDERNHVPDTSLAEPIHPAA
jgi:transposase